ncbi:MAG: hypothetical protein JXB32_04490 [Deltaproteobacteria bacterium]|nr:hypothetical protein [Deltaproteobacteria bacterium]
MSRALLCRWLSSVCLVLSGTACPPGSGTTPVEPPAVSVPGPPEGPGAAEPQRAAGSDLPWLDPEAFVAAGWEPVSVLPLPQTDEVGPLALVAVRALDGSPGAWLLFDPARPLAEAPALRFAGAEPPVPLWPAGAEERGEWTILAEQAAEPRGDLAGPLPAAWGVVAEARPPRVELLWEALEPADAVAVVDLEGEGVVELVSLRWHEVCPDPLEPAPAADPDCGPPPPGVAEGCYDEPPADPCLLLRAWSGGDGVPRAWRTAPRGDGHFASLGDPRLDRIVALLLAVDCPYVDLRDLTVRREAGLLAAGVEGELVESVRCLDPAAGLVAAAVPRLALLETPDGVRLPAGRTRSLLDAAGDAVAPAERWSRGYRLLPDLDGDGVRDWVWLERSAAGTRHVVTRGVDGRTAGTLFVAADGELVERLVAPPAGGHARLETLDWRPAPEPAALVDVLLEGADGTTRTERIVVPLAFR